MQQTLEFQFHFSDKYSSQGYMRLFSVLEEQLFLHSLFEFH